MAAVSFRKYTFFYVKRLILEPRLNVLIFFCDLRLKTFLNLHNVQYFRLDELGQTFVVRLVMRL